MNIPAPKYPQYQKIAALPILDETEIDGVRHAIVQIDVYDVLDAFKTGNPATDHAIKKILRAGRDHNSVAIDLEESKDSLDRAAQLERRRAAIEALRDKTAPQ